MLFVDNATYAAVSTKDLTTDCLRDFISHLESFDKYIGLSIHEMSFAVKDKDELDKALHNVKARREKNMEILMMFKMIVSSREKLNYHPKPKLKA